MQATYTGNDSGCIGCTYWRHFGWYGVNYTNACHFLLDTGKMRGCSPQECNKKKLDGGNNNGNCKN